MELPWGISVYELVFGVVPLCVTVAVVASQYRIYCRLASVYQTWTRPLWKSVTSTIDWVLSLSAILDIGYLLYIVNGDAVGLYKEIKYGLVVLALYLAYIVVCIKFIDPRKLKPMIDGIEKLRQDVYGDDE